MFGKTMLMVIILALIGCSGSDKKNDSSDPLPVESTLGYEDIRGAWISECVYFKEVYTSDLLAGVTIPEASLWIRERFIFDEASFELDYELYDDLSCNQLSDFSFEWIFALPFVYELNEVKSYYTETGFEAIELIYGKYEAARDSLSFFRIGEMLYRQDQYYVFSGSEPSIIEFQVEYARFEN